MKLLFIGDVVGSLGRDMLATYLPKLKNKYKPIITVVNGENSASGKGITEKIYKQMLELGAQAVTLGNHTWDQRELIEVIDYCPNLVRPANFPEGVPGKGYTIVKVNQIEVGIISIQGRTFLPPLDCPFKKVDELIAIVKKRTPIIFVDFHAEATSEKQAMGWYLDGRVSAVVGTHTHVQTADHRILPNKTAYMTDVGMTGPYDGILGMERGAVLNKFLTALPVRFEVAKGREQLNGVLIEIDPNTGAAKSISPIIINEDHPFFE
ncbi:TIGR00282 family metallophosphoesterase [Anaerobacillus sp. CMMVII]|uniref:TIGR00282 family metallophosphoesterase n=1 Tax=Anaerobacillus sp. CMMVII TaxID=2755588 RepID=UPI0021B7DAF9|nr:TIGR00282 family metallophosphoesterase [Anaerobacillus sp. CMMVII]MCT8139888.1 TIGR00282 family metallophosphoesterase [Anaerobacillus sp. CMMVII]